MDKKKLLGLVPHIQKSHTGLQRTQNHNIQFFQLKKCSKKATRQSYNINKRIIAYQSCPAKVNAHRIMIGFKLNFVETKERIWQFRPVVWIFSEDWYKSVNNVQQMADIILQKKSSLICQLILLLILDLIKLWLDDPSELKDKIQAMEVIMSCILKYIFSFLDALP